MLLFFLQFASQLIKDMNFNVYTPIPAAHAIILGYAKIMCWTRGRGDVKYDIVHMHDQKTP